MVRACRLATALLAFAAAARGEDPVGPTLPWGLHLAYGSDPATSMTVGWSTRDPVAGSVVRYGVAAAPGGAAELDQAAAGNASTFQPPGSARPQDLHLVRLTGLLPGTTYAYAVGSDAAGSDSSALFDFTTAPEATQATEWAPTLAIFGDMGISANAQDTLVWLLKDLEDGAIDFVAHIGDHG
jgi:hypothetical protein